MKIKYLYLSFLLILAVSQLHAQSTKSPPLRKFIYQTSLGYANGFDKINYGTDKTVQNTISTFRVQQQLAYQFNHYFSIGVGASVDVWVKNAFIPLFGTFNVNFMKGRLTPYLYLSGGYAFKWYVPSKPDPLRGIIHATRPGPYAEGGTGLKIRMNDRISLLIGVNYLFFYSQINYNVKIEGQPDNSAITTNQYDKVPYHFAGVKFGLIY